MAGSACDGREEREREREREWVRGERETKRERERDEAGARTPCRVYFQKRWS